MNSGKRYVGGVVRVALPTIYARNLALTGNQRNLIIAHQFHTSAKE